MWWTFWTMIAIYIPSHLPNIFATPKDGSFSEKILDWGLMQGSLVFQHGEYWRLFTAAFLHANFLHILFNMLAFVIFAVYARQYERSKYAWRWTFLVGALVGNLAIGLHRPAIQAVGASGGIMALWGGYYAIVLRAHLWKSGELGHVRHTLTLMSETINLALQVVVLDHLIKGIGWEAHLGGLITGFAIGMLVPLRGQLYIYASRAGVAELTGNFKLVTRKLRSGRKISDVEHEVTLVDGSFDPAHDFVVTSSTWVDWRNRTHQRLARVLAGHMPSGDHDWDSYKFVAMVPTVKEAEYDARHKTNVAEIVKRILANRKSLEPHHTIHEK
jgi:membrane associated rhomboid family serine protease